MKRVMVREITSEDEVQAAQIDRLATADLRKVYRPTSVAEAQRSAISRNLRRLVAILDGRVAGIVQYRIVDARLSLLGLGVHPGFRRRGVATALVRHLERIGRQTGCEALLLHTIRETGNVQIFERMGFAIESEGPTDLFEGELSSPLHEVVMTKGLNLRGQDVGMRTEGT